MSVNILGVDPGGTIGVAWVRPDGSLARASEEKSFSVVVSTIHQFRCRYNDLHVVVEDYSGAGTGNSDAKNTIGQARALIEFCKWWNVDHTLAQPQHRLSAAIEAEAAVLALHPNESATSMRNAISATAHALSWRRHHGG